MYYETVIPYLILLLKSETETSDRMLFAYSMECITMVGMAVGKEKFKDDAQQVIINSARLHSAVAAYL